LKKPFLFASTVGLMTAIVFSITILLSYQYYQEQKVQQLQLELNFVKENIRKIMTNSNLAAFSVGLTIDPIQDTVKNFDTVAKEIMSQHPYLYGVQILRKGEIKYVYPYERHESVIGFDILENPSTQKEAQNAIDKKEIYYAGPLPFKQGGKGIIGRLPIFHNREFWGFSAVLIRMDDFIQSSGIKQTEVKNLSFQLSKINPNTGKVEVFTEDAGLGDLSLNYTFEESGWEITANYYNETDVYVILVIFILLGVASTIGSAQHAYQILKRPERLETLLSEKTKEIEDNNDYLTSTFKAIPDLIFVYDKNGQYLDFHAYQNSLLYYKPKDFIGKTVYDLFEKQFAKNIHNSITESLKTGEIVNYSYYLDFKHDRKYFESRYVPINRHKVLALVRDVTNQVISSQNLEKSEQKYRNLISQASDAIFLADENGRLLELNQKGQEMTGIAENEIGKYNLTDIITLQDSKKSILEILYNQGVAFEEGNLNLKTLLPIEINCKITVSRQIQGIIRDVSVRKNYIESIQRQNEQLREIAWIQSHQVRAPVARILGLLNYLEKYEIISPSERMKLLHSIRESSLELDSIIRDVVRKTEIAENEAS